MNQRMESAFVGVVLANAAVLAAQTYDQGHEQWFAVANGAFLAMYVLEIVLRLRAATSVRAYLSDNWNVADLAIVALALLPMTGPATQLLRLVRVGKLVRHLPEMRMAFAAAGKAARGLAGLMSGLVLLLFVFGMVGVGLFPGDPHYDDIGSAMVWLFSLSTLEGFPDVLDAQESALGVAFYLSFAVLVGFLLLNLVTGIIVGAAEAAREEAKSARDEVGVRDAA